MIAAEIYGHDFVFERKIHFYKFEVFRAIAEEVNFIFNFIGVTNWT